jgi:aerobic C4-dicarboxylate transport protein
MNVDVSKLNPSVVEPYVKLTHEVGFVPFLMNIIPNTFVGAFSEGNILQVLFIAVLSGFALVWLGDRARPLVDIIEITAKMIFVIVNIVMWTAPIGAFGAIAFTVGKFGVGSLAALGKLLGSFYLTCIVFIVIAFTPLARLCGFSLLKLIRYIKEELLICIATTSSETVLPRLITKLEDLWLRRGRGWTRGTDWLFLQPRWYLPLPRDGCSFFGSSHKYAARYLAPSRLTSHPAGHLERSGRRCGSGICRSCGDVGSRK